MPKSDTFLPFLTNIFIFPPGKHKKSLFAAVSLADRMAGVTGTGGLKCKTNTIIGQKGHFQSNFKSGNRH